jgi:hypothetical protein
VTLVQQLLQRSGRDASEAADAVDQLSQAIRFGHHRADAPNAHQGFAYVVGRNQNDLRFWQPLPQDGRHLDAIEHGHPQIENDHVRSQFGRFIDRVVAVKRFTANAGTRRSQEPSGRSALFFPQGRLSGWL